MLGRQETKEVKYVSRGFLNAALSGLLVEGIILQNTCRAFTRQGLERASSPPVRCRFIEEDVPVVSTTRK
jgi:hypothetical protein